MISWNSIREKWTVTSAIIVLMVSFFIISAIFVWVTVQNNITLIEKFITVFNAFVMAVLGYLFGYVPTKTSEESIKKDRSQIEEQVESLNKAIDKYRDVLNRKNEIIKDYETIIALYEAEED